MKKPLFIAELSINHLGMVNIAKALIKSAKEAGADFVKLKIKNVDKYYKKEVRNWRNFKFLDYRRSLELKEEDFFEIDRFCKDLDIPWFATVHDDESLEFIQQFDVPMYKVASMDSDKTEFVEKVIDICKNEGKPLVISMGGKDVSFTHECIARIKEASIKAYILHTVSIYPVPVGQCSINYVHHLVQNYEDENIKIGYSGHEEGIGPSILAATYGASMIERHLTLSKNYKIHHIACAITPKEFKQLVDITSDVLVEQQTPYVSVHKDESKFLKEINYA